MIRNLSDLLHVFGERFSGDPQVDGRALSRRLFKSTACGAWAHLVEPGKYQAGKRIETWTARVNSSIVGPLCVHVRKKGRRKVDSLKAPEHVRDYLLLGGANPRVLQDVTWKELLGFDLDDHLKRRTLVGPSSLVLTFEVEAPVMKRHTGGVLIGSIVEGSDASVQPEEMRYPFTEADLYRAIENIESEADELWNEANSPQGVSEPALEP